MEQCSGEINEIIDQIKNAGVKSHKSAQIALKHAHILSNRKTRKILSCDVLELLTRIVDVKAALPERFHQCIGCPCSEYEYPSCKGCPYFENCVKGAVAYPEECTAGSCMEYQRWRNPFVFDWGSPVQSRAAGIR